MISRRAPAGFVVVGIATWIFVDLYRPVHHDLRRFDPVEVGHLETWMWRSYYDHERFSLFADLKKLLRTQYDMPFWRSILMGFHAAKAAVVFQRGDYQKHCRI